TFLILLEVGKRSGWSLHTISLRAPSCQQAIVLLESIPSLEALEIIYTRRTLDPLFERLRTDIAFLPNIREISIKWYPFPVSAEVLGGMIAVRRMGRLQSFHLFFENQATMAVSALEAIDTILRPLKAGGFEFAIGTQFPPLTASCGYRSTTQQHIHRRLDPLKRVTIWRRTRRQAPGTPRGAKKLGKITHQAVTGYNESNTGSMADRMRRLWQDGRSARARVWALH
ncbi:hypothetical protein B0H13DRAFT_1858444, partial [Mycena leptocephala]